MGLLRLLGVACIGGFMISHALGQTLTFAERSGLRGLGATHIGLPRLGMQFMAPGGAVGDFNNDGWPDVFVVGGSQGVDKLFMNQGDGTFVEQAEAWGLAATHAGSGAAVGDFDSDGDVDIYVTSLGTAPALAGNNNKLYRNNGDGTFTEIAASAGVRDTLLPGVVQGDNFSPAFGDYNLDGDLDLAVAAWYGSNRLYRNNGDGTFTDATSSIGYDMSAVRGFVMTFQDFNNDRYPELLWVGDFMTSRLFLNNTDGTFTDITAPAGVGLESNGMGSAVADFNRDGLMDWYVTSRINESHTSGSGNMLYINKDGASFVQISEQAGTLDGHWGWGTAAADFDNDGMADLVATNGWDGSYFTSDPTKLFLNNGDGTFRDAAEECLLLHNGQGRGLATLDADRDGDIDLIIFCNNEPLAYFENELAGEDAHWLTFRFDTSSRPDMAPNGFGVKVEVTEGGATQTSYLNGGSHFLATSELMLHFGLGAATTADHVVITWPTGETTTLNDVAADQDLTIQAPSDEPCPADFAPPYGFLDFFDIAGFLAAFSAHDPAADLASPSGQFDFFDVSAYLTAFSAGCP